jgi:hypothetical protein
VVSEVARLFSEPEDVLNAQCELIFLSHTVRAYYLLSCYCQALVKLNTDHLELQIQVATANQLLQTGPKTTMLIYAQLSAMSFQIH